MDEKQPRGKINVMIATQSLSSIGCICQQLGRPYSAVRKAIAELKLTPKLSLNQTDHYDDEQVERIRDYLDQAT